VNRWVRAFWRGNESEGVLVIAPSVSRGVDRF
jgi:hypothetical protein